MKKTAFQRNASACFFAMSLTIVFCLLIVGIVYIDICAQQTVLSAGGMLSPILDKIIDTTAELFRL
jgi:hypothetical protein